MHEPGRAVKRNSEIIATLTVNYHSTITIHIQYKLVWIIR